MSECSVSLILYGSTNSKLQWKLDKQLLMEFINLMWYAYLHQDAFMFKFEQRFTFCESNTDSNYRSCMMLIHVCTQMSCHWIYLSSGRLVCSTGNDWKVHYMFSSITIVYGMYLETSYTIHFVVGNESLFAHAITVIPTFSTFRKSSF